MIQRVQPDQETANHDLRGRRHAGVLLHVTSLPDPYGIGDPGPAAHDWVDALRRAQQSCWQILPLGPTGAGNSPYSALSAFAFNPDLVSPDNLLRNALLRRDDLATAAFLPGRVDYRRVRMFKARLLNLAWERFQAGAARELASGFEQFCMDKSEWLDDFALFMALREATSGKPWTQWPREMALRRPSTLRQAYSELRDSIDRHRFAQFLLHRQWMQLRQHAHQRGIRIIGDLPIFVSGESADVWAHPELFQLDRHRQPTAVAGVPPDLFSRTGQRWDNPLYNWNAMRTQGYAWWISRFRAMFEQVDAVRIDHFRGFEACWTIPAHAPTAQIGRWVKTPGMELFRAVTAALGNLPVIAEDLGEITPEVEALRDAMGFPGMRVLQFAFGGDADSPHLPHNHLRNSVVYTATHDNDTSAGWFRTLHAKARRHLRAYLPDIDQNPSWALTRLAWGSVADHAIVPLQDLLGLGSRARMNVPGRPEGNWRWRLEDDQLASTHLDRLAELTTLFGRAPRSK